MLEVIFCLTGMAVLMLLAELLWRKKILKGEGQRKFLHITAGSFIAFWPWLISWQAIQLIGTAMLAGVLINRASKTKLHFMRVKHRDGYGDIMFALAIILCATITDNKVFFAIAILHLALADGFAAVVGKRYGQNMKYKVFNQTKTVLGSMSFWFISLCIFGSSILLSYEDINYVHYASLLLFGPPILVLIENMSIDGFDNILIPVSALLILNIAQTA